jgi:hypothetical protein
MKLTLLALALVLAGCEHTPEPDEIYKSLVSVPGLGRFNVIVVYVGRNWEIKDAVNAHKISDAPVFHTPGVFGLIRTISGWWCSTGAPWHLCCAFRDVHKAIQASFRMRADQGTRIENYVALRKAIYRHL